MEREYDVTVRRRGSFSVWAESLEEAEEIVAGMDENDLAAEVEVWWETEVTSID